jgi:hypothetical protein
LRRDSRSGADSRARWSSGVDESGDVGEKDYGDVSGLRVGEFDRIAGGEAGLSLIR